MRLFAAGVLFSSSLACTGPSFSGPLSAINDEESLDLGDDVQQDGGGANDPVQEPDEETPQSTGGAASLPPAEPSSSDGPPEAPAEMQPQADAGSTPEVEDPPLPPAMPSPAEALQKHLEALTTAATQLLETLDAEGRAAAQLDFDSATRTDFELDPAGRSGVAIDDFDQSQRVALDILLQLILSDRGLQQVLEILALEREQDEDLPHFNVFGEPGAEKWGLRFEGHHLSINMTIIDGVYVFATPMYVGANPTSILGGILGAQPMMLEDSLGFQILNSLEEDLMDRALFSTRVPSELESVQSRITLPSETGVPVAEFSAPSKELVRALVEAYVGDLHPALALVQLQALDAAGYDHFDFMWRGSTRATGDHYFRLQGGDLLIELLLRGGGHVHSVWRQVQGDYGRGVEAGVLAE